MKSFTVEIKIFIRSELTTVESAIRAICDRVREKADDGVVMISIESVRGSKEGGQ